MSEVFLVDKDIFKDGLQQWKEIIKIRNHGLESWVYLIVFRHPTEDPLHPQALSFILCLLLIPVRGLLKICS